MRSSGEIPRFQIEGSLFLLVTFLVGVAALNTGNNLLYLVLILLLSFFVCSGLLALSTLAGLKIVRRPPHRVFAGSPALGEVVVENPKRLLPSFSVLISDRASGRRTPCAVHYVAKLEARERASAVVEYVFPRRGVEKLNRLSLTTRFPFGFLERGRSFWWTDEVLVYPKVRPLEGENLSSAVGIEGRSSGMKGAGQDIYSIRPFVQGDPLKRVSWKQTAKRGQLMVKDFESEDQRRVSVVLDLAPCLTGNDPAADERRPGASRPWEERIEEAIRLAASFASHFLARGFSVRFATHGTAVPSGSGPDQEDRILAILAMLDPYGMAGLPPIPFADDEEARAPASGFLVRAAGSGVSMVPTAGFTRVAEV